MTKNIYDLEETIKAMDRFLAPDAMDKRLIEKWRDAGEACALHFHLSPPAPDGDFAILLLPRRDVEKTLKIFKKDRVDVISFAAGVALAQQPGCSGGWDVVEEAQKIIRVNKDACEQTFAMDL